MMKNNLFNVKHLHISKDATMEHCDSVIFRTLFDCLVANEVFFSIKTACYCIEIKIEICTLIKKQV